MCVCVQNEFSVREKCVCLRFCILVVRHLSVKRWQINLQIKYFLFISVAYKTVFRKIYGMNIEHETNAKEMK